MMRALIALLVLGCSGAKRTVEVPEPASMPSYDQVPRADFNRIAVELGRPLFWISDEANPGTLDPQELTVWRAPGDLLRETFVGGRGLYAGAGVVLCGDR